MKKVCIMTFIITFSLILSVCAYAQRTAGIAINVSSGKVYLGSSDADYGNAGAGRAMEACKKASANPEKCTYPGGVYGLNDIDNLSTTGYRATCSYRYGDTSTHISYIALVCQDPGGSGGNMWCYVGCGDSPTDAEENGKRKCDSSRPDDWPCEAIGVESY